MSRNRPSAQPGRRIERVLADDPVLGAWLAKADREAGLTSAVRRLLSPEMAATVRVVETAGSELVLAASHGAAAARLRQLVPLLRDRLARQAGRPGVTVRVVVRPRPADADARRGATPRSIGATGVRALRDLEARLPAGSLRAALARLVSEHQDESLEQKEQEDRP